MSTFKKYMEIIQEAEITSDLHVSETTDSKLQNSFANKVEKFYSDKEDDPKDKDSLINNTAKNLFFLKQYKDFDEFKTEFSVALKRKPPELPQSAEKMFRSLIMNKKQMILTDKPKMENTFVKFEDRESINNAKDIGNAKKILEKNNRS